VQHEGRCDGATLGQVLAAVNVAPFMVQRAPASGVIVAIAPKRAARRCMAPHLNALLPRRIQQE